MTSALTVCITNETGIDCVFWIYSDAGTNVDGAVVSAGSTGEFTFSAVGGRQYTIWGTDNQWHVLTTLNEWTATLDHHALDLGVDGGMSPSLEEGMSLGSDELLSLFSGGGDPEYYVAYDFGSVLCSDSGTWPRHDYYFADGNGNVVTLVDTNQTVSASYRYDPFGNMISQSGAMADANVYRFSSKEFHVASGLYYYGYRFYDPTTQRWINEDPIEEDGGLNLFSFVRNVPTGRIDLLGRARPARSCATPTA